MFKTHDLANTQTIKRCTNFPCCNKSYRRIRHQLTRNSFTFRPAVTYPETHQEPTKFRLAPPRLLAVDLLKEMSQYAIFFSHDTTDCPVHQQRVPSRDPKNFQGLCAMSGDDQHSLRQIFDGYKTTAVSYTHLTLPTILRV